mmetsp:Transcript_9579/g.14703  ORF Transcript_9579/g.14703 Transcript_9579/m.14703 type:complete len:104 (-) Transcript_9579:124-435(-)
MTVKPYVLIEFLPQACLDQRASLHISPIPILGVRRVFMLFKPIDIPLTTAVVPLVKDPPRPPLFSTQAEDSCGKSCNNAVAVVEWGGMLCQFSVNRARQQEVL